MRWWSFAILGYVAIAVQLALSGFLDWRSAAPNLVLPVVVFVAINARREGALAAAFMLGLVHDLLSPNQPIGLFAFSYGLIALFVVGAQPSLYRDHPLTHFFVTLLAATVVRSILAFNEWAYPVLHGAGQTVRPALGAAAMSALYTAAIAPLMLYPLGRIKKVFAFRGTRLFALARG